MSDTSASLGLPFIQAAQAQKHVTHNEAIVLLDALVQTSVRSRTQSTPPAVPAEGDIYVVGQGATDLWAGQEDAVAVFSTYWQFHAPRTGWRIWTEDTATMGVYDGQAWVDIGGGAMPSTIPSLGINASATLPDRLTVSAAASLFNHQGAGHRLKVNKAATAETASLLFQNEFSGRAEMGLAGEDDFSVKVSADGSTWTTALRLDAATGQASGAAVQASATDTTAGRLMRADYGYGPGNVVGPVSQVAGVPTGAVVESGSNANGSYLRFADGTQICYGISPVMTANSYPLSSSGLYGSQSETWIYPMAFAANPMVTLTAQRVSGSHGHMACIGSGGYDELSMRVFMIASQDATGTVHMTATGRWF